MSRIHPCPNCIINMRRAYISQQETSTNGKRVSRMRAIGWTCLRCSTIKVDTA